MRGMTDELFFPPFNGTSAMWLLIAALLCIFLIIGGFIILVWGASQGAWQKRWRVSIAVFGLATMASGFVIASSSFSASQAQNIEYEAIRENRDAFISDRGVYIPDLQMENLEFPTYRPTKDAKFGIAQAEYEGKVISVFLTWEDDELKLYRTDGQELLPLD